MIIVNILLLSIGFFALVKGADMFVNGSSSIAARFHVPSLIIGLTLVAMGTSAPELAVSISAALQGSNEIAISNVVGSNLFNLLGILGICAILKPIKVEPVVLKRDIPFSIAITLIVLITSCGMMFLKKSSLPANGALYVGTVSRIDGLFLILIMIAYIIFLIVSAKNSADNPNTIPQLELKKSVISLIIGLVIIIAGGQIVVYCAKEIARAAGMTETLIGLTVVAFGTSLPELVTSIVAIKKKESAMAVGNTIGSNIFNILFILGISSVIHPIEVNVASYMDLIILVTASMITLAFCLTHKKISRLEGGMMLAMYFTDMAYAIIR